MLLSTLLSTLLLSGSALAHPSPLKQHPIAIALTTGNPTPTPSPASSFIVAVSAPATPTHAERHALPDVVTSTPYL